MDDKRIAEWAQEVWNELPEDITLDPAEAKRVLESAARTLLSEAIAEYKEDALRWREYLSHHAAEQRQAVTYTIDCARQTARKSESEHG